MEKSGSQPFRHLVIDANAIIAGAQLRGLATQYWTVAEALSEIKDSRARQALHMLPFSLETRVPSDDAIAAVRKFALKTGDMRTISRTDLLLLALTYQLEKQENGSGYLKAEPGEQQTKLGRLANFGDTRRPAVVAECRFWKSAGGCSAGTSCLFRHIEGQAGVDGAKGDELEGSSPRDSPSNESDAAPAEDAPTTHEHDHAHAEDEGEGEWSVAGPAGSAQPLVEEEDGDWEGDWVGPTGNEPAISSVLPTDMHFLGGGTTGAGEDSPMPARTLVACITTDFAMQNVLLQQGMLLATHSGKVVTSVKQWVLKCDACYTIFPASALTAVPDTLFCKKCGNATLARLGVTLGADGTPRYHYKANRRVNTRGTVYALPAPKGGRLQDGSSAVRTELLLRPDQLLMGAWQERVRQEAAKGNRESLLADSSIDDTMLAALGTASGRAAAKAGLGGSWIGPGSGSAATGGVPIDAGWGRRNPNSNRVHKHKGGK